jgi:hypothetical protein
VSRTNLCNESKGSSKRVQFVIAIGASAVAVLGYAWLAISVLSVAPVLVWIPIVGCLLVLAGARALLTSRYGIAFRWSAAALVATVILSLPPQPPYWETADIAFGPEFAMPPLTVTPWLHASWYAWHLLPWALAWMLIVSLRERSRNKAMETTSLASSE